MSHDHDVLNLSNGLANGDKTKGRLHILQEIDSLRGSSGSLRIMNGQDSSVCVSRQVGWVADPHRGSEVMGGRHDANLPRWQSPPRVGTRRRQLDDVGDPHGNRRGRAELCRATKDCSWTQCEKEGLGNLTLAGYIKVMGVRGKEQVTREKANITKNCKGYEIRTEKRDGT